MLGAAGLWYAVMVAREAPRVEGLDRSALDRATIVYTAGGEVITRFFEKNRTWVPIDQVAPSVIEALVATEDRRFYEHPGVDLRRTLGAIFQTLSGEAQGGSTITMQLARNVFPGLKDDPVLERKVKEWVTALRLEDVYGKDEILETYLNTVPFVYRAYGIEAAALTYFGRHAADLGVAEAATLVGMLKGPSLYNPVLNPERSRRRRNVVLEQMREAGYLTQAEFDALRAEPLGVDFNPVTPENNLAPYFAEHVRRQLEAWADERGYNLYTSGLRVYTTLDAELQRAAEAALGSTLEDLQAVVDVSWSEPSVPFFSQKLEPYADYRRRVEPFAYFWETHPDVIDRLIRRSERYADLVGTAGLEEREALRRLSTDEAFVDSLKAAAARLQGGFVAIDPDDGHLKAWVGGRGFSEDQFDHVAQARRQPGSTFKPFVYAAALASGFAPGDLLPDRRFRYVNRVTGQAWAPGNFGPETGELLSLREALTYSKNTITTQLVMRLGARRVADYARRMGIRSELDPVPSIGLGTSPVTLLEMAAAYTTIADLGTYHEPLAITRIENRHGEVIETFDSESRQVIPPAVAYGVLGMMRDVVDEGTGIRIRAQYEATGELAGKTGTTQRGADGWFMLIHPDLILGSWVGFDLPELTFRTRWWGQGAHTALHAAGRFYRRADLPDGALPVLPALEPDLVEDDPAAAGARSLLANDPATLEDLLPESYDAFAGEGDDDPDWQPGRASPAQLPSRDSDWTLPPSFYSGGRFSTDQLNRRERQTSEIDEYLERLEQ